MTLDRSTTEEHVDLVIIVPVPAEILYTAQNRLPIGNRRVEEMLLSLFVNAEAFEVDVAARAELWFNWTRG